MLDTALWFGYRRYTYMRIINPFRGTMITGTITSLFPGACEFREEIS
jgi:hypothetical protein